MSARRRRRGPVRPQGLAWRLRYPLFGVVVVFVIGFIGFMRLGSPPLEALTRTILVLTTIGVSEPVTAADRWLTNVVAVLGVSAYLALLAALAAVLAEGNVLESSRRRRAERQMNLMREHVILCAYGRVGRAVAAQLKREGASFGVVERLPGLAPVMRDDGLVAVTGDPSSEDVLHRMGITRARALISAVDSDADNIYITLTARALNPELFIVARASERAAAGRLYRAGADRVVSPYVSSGMQMALLATRPRVVDYIDLAAPDHRAPMRMEEVLVEAGSPLSGRTIGAACGTTTPLALRRASGEVIAPPDASERLAPGDLLVVLGDPVALATPEGETGS